MCLLLIIPFIAPFHFSAFPASSPFFHTFSARFEKRPPPGKPRFLRLPLYAAPGVLPNLQTTSLTKFPRLSECGLMYIAFHGLSSMRTAFYFPRLFGLGMSLPRRTFFLYKKRGIRCVRLLFAAVGRRGIPRLRKTAHPLLPLADDTVNVPGGKALFFPYRRRELCPIFSIACPAATPA